MTSMPEASRFDGLARWLQMLLVLSLSINLLIAGAVFGGAWVAHHGLERPGGPHAAPVMALVGPLGKFFSTLPPERKAELRDVIQAHQASIAEFNKAMAGVRREASDALLAVPFDRAKFETALKHVYTTEAEARSAMTTAHGAILARLTDAERIAFVKTLNWPGVAGTSEKTAEEGPAATKAP